MSNEAKQAAEERESLYIVSEYAAQWFRRQMTETADGRNIGLSYFRSRGISDSSMEKFALGYSPEGWSAFTEQAIAKGYKPEFLDKTGSPSCARTGAARTVSAGASFSRYILFRAGWQDSEAARCKAKRR